MEKQCGFVTVFSQHAPGSLLQSYGTACMDHMLNPNKRDLPLKEKT